MICISKNIFTNLSLFINNYHKVCCTGARSISLILVQIHSGTNVNACITSDARRKESAFSSGEPVFISYLKGALSCPLTKVEYLFN